MSMEIVPKGGCRFVMMNGTVDISEIKRIVVGPSKPANSEHPKYWIRILTVETVDQSIDVVLEGPTEDSLRMEPPGGLLESLMKQVRG